MKKLRLLSLVAYIFISSAVYSQTPININLSKTYQTIEGFGGFGPKKVWWESAPYYDQEFLNQVMGNLGSTIIRTQIYWDGELSNDNNDPNVLNEAGFNFGASSSNGKQFPFLKDVAAKGGKIIASVWTPPVWMKDFSDPTTIPKECYNGGDRKMCGGVLRTDMYEEFAEYLVAYVKTVKKQTGVDIYGISIQNEPLFANPFEAAVLRPKPYADVLKVVGARFQKEGLTQKFFGPEHMGEYTWVPGNQEYVNQLFTQSTTGQQYLDIYAVHGYTDGVANDYGSATGWTDLYNNITVAHKKPLWMTETGNQVPNTFDAAFKFAKGFHLALKFGHISGWVFWYFADNMIKNNQLTNLGYAFKNYYKYIRPGSISVDATTTDNAILVTAYKQNNSLVVVAINNSTTTKNVKLNLGTTPVPSSFKVYRYSATEMSVDKGSVSNNNFSLPANSITTLVSIDLATSTEEEQVSQQEAINVYPNIVVNNELNVEALGNVAIEHISLISVDGREIKNFEINKSDTKKILSTENIDKGMYILKIKTAKNIQSHRIIIQ